MTRPAVTRADTSSSPRPRQRAARSRSCSGIVITPTETFGRQRLTWPPGGDVGSRTRPIDRSSASDLKLCRAAPETTCAAQSRDARVTISGSESAHATRKDTSKIVPRVRFRRPIAYLLSWNVSACSCSRGESRKLRLGRLSLAESSITRAARPYRCETTRYIFWCRVEPLKRAISVRAMLPAGVRHSRGDCRRWRRPCRTSNSVNTSTCDRFTLTGTIEGTTRSVALARAAPFCFPPFRRDSASSRRSFCLTKRESTVVIGAALRRSSPTASTAASRPNAESLAAALRR